VTTHTPFDSAFEPLDDIDTDGRRFDPRTYVMVMPMDGDNDGNGDGDGNGNADGDGDGDGVTVPEVD
jgi:hypothetical protein